MKYKNPKVTIILAIISIAFFYLPFDQEALYFNQDKILNGEIWRLITGHFSHSDQTHLLWNVFALAILGSIVEQKNSRLLIDSLFSGIVLIDIFLFSPLSHILVYCGMSGALNSLLVIALWIEWKKHKDPLLVLLTFACFTKIIVEILWNNSLFTHISWPPYPYAHLVGFIAGLLIIAASSRDSETAKNEIEYGWFY